MATDAAYILPASMADDAAACGEPSRAMQKGENEATAQTGQKDIFDLDEPELAALLAERIKAPAYRAKQIFEWLYRHGATSFEQMTNISARERTLLAEQFFIAQPKQSAREISVDGTRKYLFEVDNGDLVEAVMIKQPTRMTLCVSSQVGCGMACVFCRTGTMGLRRNLRTSEILQQVLGVIRDAANFNDMFRNVVFMGMGEPLHNFEAVTRALRIMNHHHGLAIGPRKITVSSVGLVPAIERFGQLPGLANIAISLNATSDEVRTKIMPINKPYPIAKLMQTLRAYPLGPRKRITIEYVMLAGINDSNEDLKRLPQLLRGLACKVNLIPYNSNAGMSFEGANLSAPSKEKVAAWQRELCRHGLDVTVRWSKGSDIKAACGQLATESVKPRRGRLVVATEIANDKALTSLDWRS